MISPQSAPPGTVVVCVDAEGTDLYPESALTVGNSYTIERWGSAMGEPRAVLAERGFYKHSGGRIGYKAYRFRLPVTPESLKSLSCASPDHLDKGSPRRRVREKA